MEESTKEGDVAVYNGIDSRLYHDHFFWLGFCLGRDGVRWYSVSLFVAKLTKLYHFLGFVLLLIFQYPVRFAANLSQSDFRAK